MRKVNILVEGPTEERFIKSVLSPYFRSYDTDLIAIIIKTKFVDTGQDMRGGYVTYYRIKNDLKNLLADSSASLVTTMFDYYAFPSELKDITCIEGDCYRKVETLEGRFYDDIGNRRFLPYLQLHEFEGLLFSDPREIVRQFETESTSRFRSIAGNLERVTNKFRTPEEINDNPSTCPSRRIIVNIPNYQKPLFGPTIAQNIGISKIRKKCPHFNTWITKLESLS